jgi:hypothetical protein
LLIILKTRFILKFLSSNSPPVKGFTWIPLKVKFVLICTPEKEGTTIKKREHKRGKQEKRESAKKEGGGERERERKRPITM